MDTETLDEATIFSHARQIAEAAERRQYVVQACGGKATLLARIEALLDAHEKPGHVLDSPLVVDLTRTGASLLSTEAGTIVAGRYKLLEQIGEGGMGAVWVAEQVEPVKRKVAIKLIKPGMDSQAVMRRFEAERQALAMMDHPHIAKVLDGGLTEFGRPYFVMEYVKGAPITECCDAARLSIVERLRLFVQVCKAVQHAHQKGIIHRDLKPSNILVAGGDDGPAPKVIDFGLAKAVHEPLTEQTLHTKYPMVMGTALYMSPEQAQLNNLDVDTRSDIYSLGVVLYELLTGTTPMDRRRFFQADWDEVRRLIRDEDPPRPSARLSASDTLPSVAACRQSEPARLARLLRGELDWIVMKAVAKDRSRRYETANSLARDIERYLNDEPVEARPPSAGYRLMKFARRNKGLAALFLLLIAGVVGTSWGMVRAERARREADQARADEAEQRRSAEASAESAQTREAETRAVLGFVENKIFAAARPQGRKGGLGPEVTLRRAVEAALPFVDQGFAEQPLTEARLRMSLGLSFYYLGDSKTAADQWEKARNIYTSQLGPDHPDTVHSMDQLATSYFELGRHQEALEMRKKTLALESARLGPDHIDTLRRMDNLATSYAELGRHQEAFEIRKKSLELESAKLGRDNPDTLGAMNNLATSYAALGLYADALKLYEETIARSKTTLGPDHPETLRALYNQARAYAAVGRRAEALQIHEHVLARRKVILGPLHPDTFWSMTNVAALYAALGRQADALKLREETLALQKANLPAGHPDLLASMNNLALSYAKVGRRAEALELFQQALALQKVQLGAHHPRTLAMMYNLACLHALMIPESSDRGKEAELAIECLQQAVEAGYRDVGLIKKDTDLDALRNREDFKKLIREMEAKQVTDKK